MTIAVAGWVGVCLQLAAYGLVVGRRLKGHRWYLNLLNVVGAVGVGVNSYENGAWPSALANAVWALIGLVGIGYVVAEQKRQPTLSSPPQPVGYITGHTTRIQAESGGTRYLRSSGRRETPECSEGCRR